ncbi:MAG: type IVB secretion system protein IcmH/DotU [Pseudomonadota bacterium]|nr:type IVB secretion system protein IcmH/DotU [Pseudomonadota bacterium]
MSEGDDPFARADKTIIRPNPGGRLPATPTPSPPPPAPTPYAGGAPPVSRPQSSVAYPSAPPPAAPGDDWMAGRVVNPYAPTGAAPPPLTPAPASPHVSVDLVMVADNPLMRAAASLLLALGRLRASLSRAGTGPLMDQVAQAIEAFERDARAAGAPAEQVQVAKYALAATADDIVQNLPTEDRHVWTRYSMLVRFFGERTGGVKFFQELDRAKQNPAVNLGLLELMHACLSLGFEGVYRAAGGMGALQGLRRDLYETIRRARPKTIEDLSPHWRGLTIGLAGNRLQIPAWAVGAAAGALLLAVYLVLRHLLSGQAEALALKMSAFYPDTEIQLGRVVAVAPPPAPKLEISPQLQCIRKALASEIMAGKVSAEQTASTIFVRVGSVVLFPSGGANANTAFAPIARKIAQALDKQPGDITVTGYTDADPIKTIAFPSNFELSEARAKSAAALLKPNLADPKRLVVKGKGASDPVAPNDVEADKAKNRRVEISIPRDDERGSC